MREPAYVGKEIHIQGNEVRTCRNGCMSWVQSLDSQVRTGTPYHLGKETLSATSFFFGFKVNFVFFFLVFLDREMLFSFSLLLWDHL